MTFPIGQRYAETTESFGTIGRHMYRLLLVGEKGTVQEARRMLTDYSVGDFGFDVRWAATVDDITDNLTGEDIDVVLADLETSVKPGPGAMSELLAHTGDRAVVILTREHNGAAMTAVAHGAQDVLIYGQFDAARLAWSLRHAALRQSQLSAHARQSNEYRSNLRAVVSQSSESVVVLDGDGVVRFANQAACELFGRGSHELIGMPFEYPTECGRLGEITITRPNETTATATTRTAIVSWHGAEAKLVTLNDVTELRRKDLRLRQAINLEAVGRVTAGVAHDFNNKLTVITGFSRLALAQVSEGHPLAESIQEIARAASQAARLVNQLLSLGKKQMHPTTVDLASLIEALKPSLASLVGPGVEISYDLADDVGSVHVDPVQMEEAITNLATNARDAMPAGGELRIGLANVDLPASHASQNLDASAGAHVVLSVTDTGIGMDEQTRKQVFEPFFTTKPSGKGTGLGLATVYAFTVQSGGHVTVDSSPGGGTKFSVYLPRIRQQAEQPARTDFSPDLTKGRGTILVAEDEQQVRDLLCRVLTACGYTVIDAADGFEALAKSEAHEGKIDLLITDIVMAGMNGRMLAGNLIRTRPETKMLYISGYTGGIANADEIAAEGAVLLPKPFSPDSLLAAVRQRLEQVEV